LNFLLKLKNKENEFVSAAFFSADESSAKIKDLFYSSAIEYDWAEDNTLRNSIEILSNTIYTIKNNACGIVFFNGFDFSKKAENFVKKNLYKTACFLDDSSIFLEERWLPSAESIADEIIQIVELDNSDF